MTDPRFFRQKETTQVEARADVSAKPPRATSLRERPTLVKKHHRTVFDALVLLGILGFLLTFFTPGLLFSETTATGGDTGAHIYAPWYLKNHLLPDWQIAGWSPDWFAGFPIYTFYFPLIATFQAVLGYLIPYEIAFKLGTVLGTFLLPGAFYVFMRLLRLPFPTPAIAAALSLGFLFMDSYSIYGGNIASSLSGEYSFSLSVALCLVFYGLAYRIATGEDGRPIRATVVLALAAVSHVVPVIIVVLMAPLFGWWALRHRGPRRVFQLVTVLFIAFGLTAFWSIPFIVRIGYAANMRWIPLEGLGPIFPREIWLYVGLAVLGGCLAFLRRDKRMIILGGPALLGVLIYLFLPSGHAWNGRFLPFWYIGVFLSAAYLLGGTIPLAARWASRRRMPLGVIALAGLIALGAAGWVQWERGRSFVASWIRHNYEGSENKPRSETFDALTERIARLPAGRVLWEPAPELGQFGTPIALMALPYWSDHPSMEGIYYESSITTPFHFMLVADIAENPSNPIPGLPYGTLDMDRAVKRMLLYDIPYLVTVSDTARRAANREPDLTKIDDVEEFTIFGLETEGQVVIPRYEPVVLARGDWVDTNVEWFAAPGLLDVPLVTDGPSDWTRVAPGDPLPRRSIAQSEGPRSVEIEDEEISFSTDAIGTPHWIKTSYFPNWRAIGAEGPYLASPSLMMVIPTQQDVRLVYQRTWAEWLGLALTFGSVVVLVIRPARRRLFLERSE